MGYTPLFDSALDGTLYGKWPHTGIWTCLLSQCNRHGEIDVVPALIAAKIGVPVETLLECIADFMKPDPGSRTSDFEGRRLELIEPATRNWGWRVINHGQYRNKARKAAYDADRTASGADAERKRASREASRIVPPCPSVSPGVPPSDSDSDSDKNTNKDARGESEAEIRQHILLIKARWPKGCPHEDWITAEKLIRNLVTAGSTTGSVPAWGLIEAGVERYARFCKATNRMVKNPAMWFGDISRPWLSDWAIPPKPGEKPAPNHDAAWAEARWLAREIGFRDPFPQESVGVYMTEVTQARDAKPKTPLAERRGLAGIKRIAK